VHPAVLESYSAGKLDLPAGTSIGRRNQRGLSAQEHRVQRLLRRSRRE